MRQSGVRDRVRSSIALVIGMGVMALLPGPVGAVAPPSPRSATPPAEHYVVDNKLTPGAACLYPDAIHPTGLRRIRVRPPVVFAQDRRDGRFDRQRVAWRFVVQSAQIDADYGDARAWRSDLQSAVATDHAPAPFTSMVWRAHANAYRQRVIVRIFWYRHGVVVAKARHTIRYYRYRPMSDVYERGCNG